jgi:hypothetical protein
MDATPALFGPTQSPLVAIHLHQAPVSLDVAIVLLNRVGTAFIDLRRIPPDRFRLADPVCVLQAVHLLSIRSHRVKSATSSGLDATPALFRPMQSPLAAYHLRQAPTSIEVSPLREPLYGGMGAGFAFLGFHRFPRSLLPVQLT